MNMEEIFISYSRKDMAQVEKIAFDLHNLNLSYWMDKRNIQIGDIWTTQIPHAIEKCRVFLLIISPNSMASDIVRREVQLADEKKKKFFPLVLEETPIPSDFQLLLVGIQKDNYKNPDWKSHLLVVLGKTSGSEQSSLIEPNQQSTRDAKIITIRNSKPQEIDSNDKDDRDSDNASGDHQQNQQDSFQESSQRKMEYLSSFEIRINQVGSNPNILVRAEQEFFELSELAAEIATNHEALGFSSKISKSNLERMEELARTISHQAHSAAATIASGGAPTAQLNQIKQNLPTVRQLLQQTISCFDE